LSDCTIAAVTPEVLVEILTGLSLDEYQRAATVTLQVQRHLFFNYVDRIGLTLLKRLISELLDLADQFGTPHPHGTALEIRVTHADLADCIGASRQRVTQCLRVLERRRALTKRGRTLICDVPRLRRLMQQTR
jgi:CRP-like cAMP-binding protein